MNEIKTAAELDALPVGSVVMEGPSGEPVDWVFGVKVMPGTFHRFPDGWYVVAGLGIHEPAFDLGPITVLYRPDAEPVSVLPSVELVARSLFAWDISPEHPLPHPTWDDPHSARLRALWLSAADAVLAAIRAGDPR